MHPRHPRGSCRPFLSAAILLGAAACADGAKKDLPVSEVNFAANHHVLALRSLPGFGSVARANAVVASHFSLAFAIDSNYTTQSTSGGSDPQRYALAGDGSLSIFNGGSGREPSVVFNGAYRLVGDQPDLFFTDRVSAGSSLGIGLFYGTRTRTTDVELAGDWQLASLHVMLTPEVATVARQIARGAHGTITVPVDPGGDTAALRTITGQGQESGNDTIMVPLGLGGSIQYLHAASGSGDGSCNLTLSYAPQNQASDSRVCRAVVGKDIVLALDEDASDGEVGMVFLVRAPAAPLPTLDAVAAGVIGEYLVGGYTLFVNPANNGSDAFVGTLTLAQGGGFRLDAVGHQGVDFSYTGTYQVTTTGRITMHVNGTNEDWTAAITPQYDTLVLVDDVVETRTNNVPELNLLLGVRKKTN